MRGRALGGLTTFMLLGQFLSPIAAQPFRQSIGMAATYGLTGVLLATLAALIWMFKKQICHAVRSTVGSIPPAEL
ncbi:MAG: MFS transporter [Leptolyngbya sp. SIO4C1]|nr:MFS transporter [Leptolyngbya sp. SIO4C1]